MKEKAKEYICSYCGEVYNKPISLAAHVRLKHKGERAREREREMVTHTAERPAPVTQLPTVMPDIRPQYLCEKLAPGEVLIISKERDCVTYAVNEWGTLALKKARLEER
jgi:hypothetical protein